MNRAKVVLVTHVGQGFGRAIALAYGVAGYDVVCADRDVDLAARTAAEIEELGGQAIPIQADTTAALDVQAAFHKVWEIFGSLSGVVHVAGYESATAFHNLSESELTELFDETVRSSVLVLRAAQRSAPGAWVVLVAPAPHPERPHIAAVGGALARLAATFPVPEPEAQESDDAFAPRHVGLRVNVVVPSRPAADPRHDAPLVHAVRLLGSQAGMGVHGAEIQVTLPAPPRVMETLLPEVQAALDDTVRQSEDGDDDEVMLAELQALAIAIGHQGALADRDALADEHLDDASLQHGQRALAGLTDQPADEAELQPSGRTKAWRVWT